MSATSSGGFHAEIGALPGNHPDDIRAASLYVCGRATDAADARALLLMLGLTEAPRKRPQNRDVLGRVVAR